MRPDRFEAPSDASVKGFSRARTTHRTQSARAALAPAALFLALVTGCQLQPPAATPSPRAPEPTPLPTAASPAAWLTLTDDEGTTVTLAEEPERVISLTPATTELLFALDQGGKLVGRTDFDDYPPDATELPAVATFTGVLIEKVIDLEPDLVIAGGNNFTAAGDVARLRELGLPVLVVYAADLAGVLDDILLVGRAVDAEAEAGQIVGQIDDRIAEVGAAIERLEHPRVFYELGFEPEIYGPAPGSFVADMVVLAGGEPVTTSDPVVFSISLEQLVSQDPQVIVLGDAAYGTCPEAVAQRPGWDSITAVAEGHIRPVNDIIVTRPGPRIGEGLAALALAIHPGAQIDPPDDAGGELCAGE